MSDKVNTGKIIVWNREKYIRFVQTLVEALEKKMDVFVFDECQFAIGYATYLAEYLGQKFSKG